MRTKSIYLGALLLLFTACERDIDELSEATYSTNPDVFKDTFSAGLNYAAFGGSKLDAGGTYFTSTPRDLSGYNVLS